MLKFLAYIAAAAVLIAFPPLLFAFSVAFVLYSLWVEIQRDKRG